MNPRVTRKSEAKAVSGRIFGSTLADPVAALRKQSFRAALLAAAAVLVVAAVTAIILSRSFDPGVWPAGRVARIVELGSSDVPGGVPEVTSFAAGDRLDTPSQIFRRVATRSGVELMIEDDTRLVFDSPSRITLQSGGITVMVPGGAGGFTVDTPGGQVVDLGTRFAVRVDEQRHTSVQVVEGKVRLRSNRMGPAASADLLAGQAGGIEPGGRLTRGPGEAVAAMVMRDMPSSPSAAALLALRPEAMFPFDRDSQPLVLNSSAAAEITSTNQLRLERGGPPGCGGGYVSLAQGDAPTILTNALAPLTRQDGYSLMLWIRPSTRASQNVLTATDGSGPDRRIGPQIRIRPDGMMEHVGPDGRAVQQSKQPVLFNQWSLVTITMDHKRRMHLYLNGMSVGRPTLSPVSISSSLSDLAIGGPSGRRRGVEDHLAAFAGGIDELAWFDRALTPEEVRSVYRASAR